jgi:hypothetical protein
VFGSLVAVRQKIPHCGYASRRRWHDAPPTDGVVVTELEPKSKLSQERRNTASRTHSHVCGAFQGIESMAYCAKVTLPTSGRSEPCPELPLRPEDIPGNEIAIVACG